MFEIRRIETISQDCVRVIRNSFITVANEFNLIKEEAPSNPAFIEKEALEAMKQKGIDMYGAYSNGILIGFVAIEKVSDELYYMEKLAVLPEYRHNGYGLCLINFVADAIREAGGRRISIGIINENKILKDWYIKNGFVVTEVKQFTHLPFDVCFLIRTV